MVAHTTMSALLFPGDARGAGDLGVTAATMPGILPLSIRYKLSPGQTAFFKSQTGIDDDEALKNHILGVQERAYKVTELILTEYRK